MFRRYQETGSPLLQAMQPAPAPPPVQVPQPQLGGAVASQVGQLANSPGAMQDSRYARGAARLSEQIAPGGNAAGQFNAMADQSAAGIRQGIASNLEGQFLGVRDLNENQRLAEASYQSALGQPMQGGNWSGVDRERRLDMLSPENNSAQQYAQRRASTGEGKRDAIVNALMQQGVSLDELVDAEQRDGRHGLASLLNPGTVLRGMGEGGVPFTVVRGPGEPETTPKRLQAIEARQGRNVEARRERIQSRRDAFAKRQENQERTMAMMMDPMNDPRIRSNPDAMGALMQGRNAAEANRIAGDELAMTREAFDAASSPQAQAEARQGQAIDRLLQMTPEERNGPLGRMLQQEAMGGQQGGPLGDAMNPQPRTVEDARFDVESAAPRVMNILGFDPRTSTPSAILKEIEDRKGTAAELAPEDQMVIEQFMQSMSMADRSFASKVEAIKNQQRLRDSTNRALAGQVRMGPG
jgi:hypothetical protein